MFPQRLDSTVAYDIAKAMMDGFNRHYRLFRAESARAKHRFETRDWRGQQRAQRERIEFYDLRVTECVKRLIKEFGAGEIIIVDIEDDDEVPGEKKVVFRAIEGFEPPPVEELEDSEKAQV